MGDISTVQIGIKPDLAFPAKIKMKLFFKKINEV